MLKPVRITAPADTPISLAEAKANMRVDGTDEDALITSLIGAAVDLIDGWSGILGRCVFTQTWRQDFQDFPSGRMIRLPLDPVQSVTVVYSDTANVEQTLSGTFYSLHTDDVGPFLWLLDGQNWPSVNDRLDAVRIEMVVGYGAASDVPNSIKQALFLMVGHWYENREASGKSMQEIPLGVYALLAPYRRISI